MKRLILLCFTLVSSASFTFAQNSPGDALLGLWLPSSGKARINIVKKEGKYFGKIVWLREPNNEQGKPKLDKNNADESKRSLPLLGYLLLKDFTFKGDNTWEDGTIYDPENGSTYSCTIKMIDSNTLDVRGYIGLSVFGRTDTWKRIAIKK
jgi:uncharacterized protein (DUF2147 family)